MKEKTTCIKFRLSISMYRAVKEHAALSYTTAQATIRRAIAELLDRPQALGSRTAYRRGKIVGKAVDPKLSREKQQALEHWQRELDRD